MGKSILSKEQKKRLGAAMRKFDRDLADPEVGPVLIRAINRSFPSIDTSPAEEYHAMPRKMRDIPPFAE